MSFLRTIVKAIRRVKAMIAFKSMRLKAAKQGFMSDEEIEAEIAAYREERRLNRSALQE